MRVEYQLLLWWVLFGGTHILGSAVPVRTRLIRALSLGGFKALYSVVSLATFVPLVWVAWNNRHEGAILYDAPPWMAHVTETVMLLAVVLIVLGYSSPNPATTLSELSGKTTSTPRGIHRVTRHPMATGFSLFGIAHMLSNPTVGDWIFWGGFVVFGLLSTAHQDRRLLATGTSEFRAFHGETSSIPFAAIFAGKQKLVLRELRPLAVLLAVVIVVVLRLIHPHVIGGFR